MIEFAAGVIFAGIFRISFGRIVLREMGKWKFEFRRFDEEDQRTRDAWEKGYEAYRQALKGGDA
ncbi:hypothetical protein [Brucella pituitosa]|uniref:hypothetical protein n=1 Tax=Brucella pituitosa TaxID=571256 RepID=UPI003F4AA827